MHTCSTSTSPPSSDQQVWWRDRLDLQHDGVVYMVENFCSRASPTNSREGERKASKAARVWRRGVWVWCTPNPLYIEGGAALAPPPSPKDKEWGHGLSPLLETLSLV